MEKLLKSIITMALVMFLFNACGKNDTKDGTESKYLTIKGSDTMVHLVSNWAEAYMKAHTESDISVTGGGSGTGIAALLNGTTDICMASRKIKQKELDKANENKIQPKEFIVARDGIAVVVNPENPVSELTIEQIGKIYTGEYTNWKQVGGPDQPILILSRESSSGTYVFFQEHVLGKKDYTEEARLMPSTSAIIQSVTQDKWAIGYVGLGYAIEAKGKVKTLNVKETETSPTVTPSVETVQKGDYPISRPLHLYTNGEPTGECKSFVDFCFSEEGQKIVLDNGYVPIK